MFESLRSFFRSSLGLNDFNSFIGIPEKVSIRASPRACGANHIALPNAMLLLKTISWINIVNL
jgi:hypothetical protein